MEEKTLVKDSKTLNHNQTRWNGLALSALSESVVVVIWTPILVLFAGIRSLSCTNGWPSSSLRSLTTWRDWRGRSTRWDFITVVFTSCVYLLVSSMVRFSTPHLITVFFNTFISIYKNTIHWNISLNDKVSFRAFLNRFYLDEMVIHHSCLYVPPPIFTYIALDLQLWSFELGASQLFFILYLEI